MADDKIQIFLDLDGVIADFEGHAHAEGKLKPGGGIDFAKLDHGWWAGIPAYAGARGFYDNLKREGIVKFLTGPVPDTGCFSGKAEWVRGFVPEKGRWILMDLIICPSKDKAFLAAPGRILIDDREACVDAWRKAGGIAIQHKGDFADTLKQVRKEIAKRNPPPPGRAP